MNSTKHTTTATLKINAPASALFEVITDHEGTDTWIDEVKQVTLDKVGTPKNGIGAVRRVEFKPVTWTPITEAITAYEPAKGFEYKITGGMPGLVDHLGQWRLEDNGDGSTTVTWEVNFEFKKWHWFALFLSGFLKSFSAVQQQALNGLAAKVAQ